MVLLDSGFIAISTDCCCGGGTGACCLCGVCSTTTHEECDNLHGSFQEGVSCDGLDCTSVLQSGCCICPAGSTPECPGPFQCCETKLETECAEGCTFFAGEGGFGAAFCCGDNSDGTPCSVCFACPPSLEGYCCPDYPAAGGRYCCLTGDGEVNPHYTCCGQGDNSCCNDLTQQCCENVDPESGDPFNYCCGLDETCCGFFGCCPAGTTCTELGCV